MGSAQTMTVLYPELSPGVHGLWGPIWGAQARPGEASPSTAHGLRVQQGPQEDIREVVGMGPKLALVTMWLVMVTT